MRRARNLKMLVMVAGLTAFAVSGVGSAVPTPTCNRGASEAFTDPAGGNSVAINQTAPCTVEPLLSRTDQALVYVNDAEPDNLGEANIKALSFNASAGKITASITTAELIPTNITELIGNPATGQGVRLPYGGVHVLMLFQSPQLEVEQIMGTTATGGNSVFGPYRTSDNFHFFLYYGVTASEGATPTCGWGVYDQFGQLFSVFSQALDTPQNYTCTNDKANKKINFSFPYLTTTTLQPEGISRAIRFAAVGNTISNIKAFSWMDHEVGGPPPIGLIIGATHYTDAVPAAGYDFGAFVGDPNSGGVPGPTCGRYTLVGRVPNPLYTGSACYVSLQGSGVGLGMRPTSLNVVAG